MRRLAVRCLVSALALGTALGVGAADSALAQEKKTLKVVMHSGLRITDPILTTAYISRNHGYMIYDVLFAVNEKFEVKPQMVEKYEVSGDKLTYTFTLRDGLKFHDGAPVTTADVIASLQRWGKVDGMGQKLMGFVKELSAKDDKTFQLILKEPYGLVMDSLAKPSSNVPFIMPKRMADTPHTQNVTEEIGSGPFRMVRAEFQPGVKVVYEKNPDYKPRAEPANSLSGGKVAKLDRVEWVSIGDSQTTMNALIKGEIDMWEQPPHDLLPVLKKEKDVALKDYNPLGFNGMLRMNWLQPPLDNPKVRRAILAALQQEDYLAAQVGDPEFYKVCGSMYGCGTPLESAEGAIHLKKPDMAAAKKLLAESGYKGEKIVIMQPTDLAILVPLAPVTVQAMRNLGMNVEMQSMDWQTLVGRRAKMDPIDQGGWHIFHTVWATADIMNPISNAGLRGLGRQGGFFGWTEDPELEKMRDAYARETDPVKQKQLGIAVQKRGYEMVTFIPLGQYGQPIAYRKNLSGFVYSPATVFWNIEKK